MKIPFEMYFHLCTFIYEVFFYLHTFMYSPASAIDFSFRHTQILKMCVPFHFWSVHTSSSDQHLKSNGNFHNIYFSIFTCILPHFLIPSNIFMLIRSGIALCRNVICINTYLLHRDSL